MVVKFIPTAVLNKFHKQLSVLFSIVEILLNS